MPAYVIGAIQSINDPPTFAHLQKLAMPTIAKHGGKVVVAGTNIEVADGRWAPVGMVVLEFESLKKAKAWYNSSDYNPLVSGRQQSTDSGLIFVDGG